MSGENLCNKRYGRLTVVRLLKKDKYNHSVWLCRCDCGNTTTVTTSNLNSGKTNSCGCYHKETVIQRNTKHNMRYTKLYHVYKGMIKRCKDSKNNAFKNYGARGIRVCDEWLHNPQEFFAWAVENGYSEGLTIDRINVNGNYEPSNCRWITREEQSLNTRSNVRIEYEGEMLTIAEIADRRNEKYTTIYMRYRRTEKVC